MNPELSRRVARVRLYEPILSLSSKAYAAFIDAVAIASSFQDLLPKYRKLIATAEMAKGGYFGSSTTKSLLADMLPAPEYPDISWAEIRSGHAVLKHLSGQHDQSTHGRGGVADVESLVPRMSKNVDIQEEAEQEGKVVWRQVWSKRHREYGHEGERVRTPGEA